MPFSLTGTTLVALAEEKSIFPLSTTNQSRLCKENTNSLGVVLFWRVFGPEKLIFPRVKCNVLQTTQVIKMMSHNWRKKVPWGEQFAKQRV